MPTTNKPSIQPRARNRASFMGRDLHRVGLSWYDVTGIALETAPGGGRWYPKARQIGLSLAEAKRAIRAAAATTLTSAAA